jgi:site-specific recombinase XerD
MAETNASLVLPSPATHDPAALAALGFLTRYKTNTRRAYTQDLRAWFAWCLTHQMNPLEVRRAHVELFARELEATLAPATVARRIGTVCGFYKTAVIDGILEVNPALYVRRPAVPADSQTLGLSHLQFEAVLVAARARPRDHALIVLLGLLGLRVSEACGIDITDLSLEHGHRVVRIMGKGSRPALIPLPPIVSRAIDDLIGARTDGPLLLSNYGNRLDRKAADRIVKRVAVKAHVPHKISPHSLRHTMVTTMLDAGVDLRDVQIAARHSDPKTTLRYDRARNNLDRHPVYRLAAFMAGAA